MIAVVGVIRSPLTAIASAPARPQLLDDAPDVARPDEVVGLAAAGRDRAPAESSSWRTIPVPVSGDEPGGDARLLRAGR